MGCTGMVMVSLLKRTSKACGRSKILQSDACITLNMYNENWLAACANTSRSACTLSSHPM